MVDCIYNFQVCRQPKMTKKSYCLTEVAIFTGKWKYGCAETNEKSNHLAKKNHAKRCAVLREGFMSS